MSKGNSLFDPPVPPSEAVRPSPSVAEHLRADSCPPPESLLDSSEYTPGIESIPASRYYSKEFADQEKEKLWPKVWQYACWNYDIPNPGDTHVYRILERSVLIVRQRDGSLKAFINSCLHRGRELCEEHGQNTELKCPYHFFTWNLEGDFKFLPSEWDFEHIDQDDFRLPEIQVEEWNGFVFVNFDPEAVPLKNYLGRMIGQWKGWDFTKRYKAAHVEKLTHCNWKTGQDAFIEGFHAVASHSQASSMGQSENPQIDIYPDDPHTSRFIILAGYPSTTLAPTPPPEETFETFCGYMYPELLGTEEGVIKEGENSREACARVARLSYQRTLKVDTSSLSNAEVLDSISYFVFPNFMPWPCLAFPLVYRFRPTDDPDWCIWETMLFLPFEGERPPSAEVIKLGPEDSLTDVEALGPLGYILSQDDDQIPAVQRGMKNSKSGQLMVSKYQEARIRHYHQTLTKYLET